MTDFYHIFTQSALGREVHDQDKPPPRQENPLSILKHRQNPRFFVSLFLSSLAPTFDKSLPVTWRLAPISPTGETKNSSGAQEFARGDSVMFEHEQVRHLKASKISLHLLTCKDSTWGLPWKGFLGCILPSILLSTGFGTVTTVWLGIFQATSNIAPRSSSPDLEYLSIQAAFLGYHVKVLCTYFRVRVSFLARVWCRYRLGAASLLTSRCSSPPLNLVFTARF